MAIGRHRDAIKPARGSPHGAGLLRSSDRFVLPLYARARDPNLRWARRRAPRNWPGRVGYAAADISNRKIKPSADFLFSAFVIKLLLLLKQLSVICRCYFIWLHWSIIGMAAISSHARALLSQPVHLYLAGFFFSLLFVFRDFFLSGFGMVAGDMADGRIMITLLEHWRAVFRGEDVWGSPRFYYPLTGILGNTDAHALLGVPYTMARLVMNEYSAYETTLIVTTGLGYCFMAVFLRRCLELGHVTSTLGAVIFTVCSPAYFHMGHAQFVNAAYLPLLMTLAFVFCCTSSRSHMWLSGIAIAVLFPLLALSSFYLAYFTGLFLLIALIVTCLLSSVRPGAHEAWIYIRHWSITRMYIFLTMSIVFSICMVPWLILYLPKAGGSDAFSVAAALSNSHRLGDLINSGDTNFVWGWALGPSHRSWMTFYPGFPLLFVVLVSATFAVSLVRWAKGVPAELDTLVVVAGLAGAIMWLGFAKIGSGSLLTSLSGILPGVSALRVPARLPLFLGAVGVAIAMFGFQQLVGALRVRLGSGALRMVVVFLACLMVAEQGQARSTHRLHARNDDQILARIPAPPAYCKSFFTDGISDRPYEPWEFIRVFYGPQTDAMMLAYRVGIPTLIGMSSIIPKEWDGISAWGDRYHPAVRALIETHHLTGVCRLDLVARSWTRFPAPE